MIRIPPGAAIEMPQAEVIFYAGLRGGGRKAEPPVRTWPGSSQFMKRSRDIPEKAAAASGGKQSR
jgi:hypothetical protein